MNDKLEKLSEQAEEYMELPMPDDVYHMGDDVFRRHKVFNRERFAELIVNECADWVKSRTGSGELRDELKRHFGVKE